jgi:hypothetical protein
MTLWDQLLPYVIGAAALVIPAGAGFIVAWFKAKTRELGVVREAVAEVEEFASRPENKVSPREKRELALGKIQRMRPRLARERASQLIERVLPGVRAESGRPAELFRSPPGAADWRPGHPLIPPSEPEPPSSPRRR